MEFTGFRPEGLDLLIENRMMNSKEFYDAHKTQIRALVQEPFYALIERMEPKMRKIDPLFIIEPHRMISRVRRDTRYTKDKSLYRDHVWLTFGRMKGDFASRPCYYFEVSPESWSYGCGYYQAPPSELQLARQMILSENKLFLEAYNAVNSCKEFAFYGEEYKRIKYPDAPEKYQSWLQHKNIGVSRERTDFERLWSADFVDEVLAELTKLAPLYRFMCAVKERAAATEAEARA